MGGGRKGHLGLAWVEAGGVLRRITGFVNKSEGVYARVCRRGQQIEASGRVRRVKEKLTVRTSRTHDTSPLPHPTTTLQPQTQNVFEPIPLGGLRRTRSQVQRQHADGSEAVRIRGRGCSNKRVGRVESMLRV